MLFIRIWIPENESGPYTREEFDTWVDTIPNMQVFKNGSEETASLLEKAHPETVVCLVHVDSLPRFCYAYGEQMRKEMAFIQDHLSCGGIAVFEPYRECVFDGMRFVPKEVK